MAPGALLRERHSEREFLSWLRDIGGGFWVAAPSMGTHGSKTYACCKLEGFVLLFFFCSNISPHFPLRAPSRGTVREENV